VFPHLTGDVSYNLMAILEFNPELSSRQGFGDDARELNYFLIFGHKCITALKYTKKPQRL
jgi:hypothetical protein